MMMKPKGPFLGVAYYPEDWPESEMPYDIGRMKEIGIKCIRIGEFAWHRMEPKCGEFDFSLFRRVVDYAKEQGMSVVMCTPSCTPPIWLSKKHPDVFKELIHGRRKIHGGRRHCCSNNENYVYYSLRIAEKMAEEFAHDENIIGWQIDYEIYEKTPDGGCFCERCVKGFHKYLENKYKTIDNLNERWNLNLFSQWYDDFSDIPAPRDNWHNPHIRQEWIIYQNESDIEFVRKQAEILHKYVSVPVGTDTVTLPMMDYRHMTKTLDVVQFNHYNAPETLHECSFWFDHMRTLKEVPFWNLETATCWKGAAEITNGVKPDGFCKVNSWLPIALGAETNMYWLWRTHWAGHEIVHSAVLDTSGRDIHIVGEVKETAEGFEKSADFLAGTRVKTDVALHYESVNAVMNTYQRVVKDLDYLSTLQYKWYRPIIDKGLRPDVIDSWQPLDGYRLIFSPIMMTLECEGLADRMAEWVKNGGTWVVGPLTDVRDDVGARYKDRFYGTLETLTGIRWNYSVPDTEGYVKAAWADGEAFDGEKWYEMCDAHDAETLVKVTAGHSAFAGKSLVVKKKVGKGEIILVGSIPSEKDMKRLIDIAAFDSEVKCPKVEGKLVVSERKGEDGDGMVIVEYGNIAGKIYLDHPMKNLITQKTVEGTVEIAPYEVMVLKN